MGLENSTFTSNGSGDDNQNDHDSQSERKKMPAESIYFIYQIENGLSGMKRDVILKLCKFMCAKKIRMVVGMCGQHFVWKERLLRYLPRKCPIAFVPKTPPCDGTYTGTRLSGSQCLTVFIQHDISSSRGIFLLKVDLSASGCAGLALKSAFPLLHWSHLGARSGDGVYDGETSTPLSDGWSYTSSPSIPVSLELDQTAHTLHFFAKGHQIPHVITNVPADICLAVGICNPFNSTVDVHSLQLLRTNSTSPTVTCTGHPWEE